ncbi:hypothetical protein PsYK624_153150 [Phanerochaete sordida]|uniref:Uncharacterized protein n=1 Tax=Phanerochaete sordida TaxID=48140 RepID=A0A9P3GRL2_9APHY|nr:hypothetical protein PsYK624_153150 [Phanerochaete sordida]
MKQQTAWLQACLRFQLSSIQRIPVAVATRPEPSRSGTGLTECPRLFAGARASISSRRTEPLFEQRTAHLRAPRRASRRWRISLASSRA